MRAGEGGFSLLETLIAVGLMLVVTGSVFSSTVSRKLNIAVLAPMPSARESTAVSVNPGLRSRVRHP